MQGDPTNRDDEDDFDDVETNGDEESSFDDDAVETVVLADSDFTDNVGDVSVEINVEELVAKVESEQDEDAKRKKKIRQRLEELAEKKELEDTYAIDFDD